MEVNRAKYILKFIIFAVIFSFAIAAKANVNTQLAGYYCYAKWSWPLGNWVKSCYYNKQHWWRSAKYRSKSRFAYWQCTSRGIAGKSSNYKKAISNAYYNCRKYRTDCRVDRVKCIPVYKY